MLFALVLAALAGATMALQGALNSGLGKVLGWLETTLVVHVVGTAAAAAALFL
ncbi:MAG: DMT family transporter, partial [Firmicutes bacterium]|nr:DMT family transporter [Bacillota bacterium]